MTTTDIAGLCERLRAALEGVTPGPWKASLPDEDGECELRAERPDLTPTGDTEGLGDIWNQKDATFIALSREAVPALLDTLERQAAEIERLRGAAKEGLICAEADVEARRGQLEEWVEYEPDDAYLAVLIARRDLIRAVLTGENA